MEHPDIERVRRFLKNDVYLSGIKDLEKFSERLYETYHRRSDIISELRKMSFWLDCNPQRRKKNYARFICNWMNKKTGGYKNGKEFFR